MSDLPPEIQTQFEYFQGQVREDDNVIGTYTDENNVVVVLVKNDEPPTLETYALYENVKFVKSEPFIALANTQRMRPFSAGISIGHIDITAGTASLKVKDKQNSDVYVLGNAHVISAINAAEPDDPIVQPGVADGGGSGDTVARYTRHKPIRWKASGQRNKIDCAIAKLTSPSIMNLDILDIGHAYEIGDAYINQFVWKSGRTTERTRGKVIATNAVLEIGYGPGQVAVFEDVIIAELGGAPGDSGSPVLDFASNHIIGLLFAGNSTQTIICKSRTVFNELDIELLPTPAMTTALGDDISRWQGELTAESVDKMYHHGIRFVILKVMQGTTVDPKFKQNYELFEAHGGFWISGYMFHDLDFSVAEQMATWDEATKDFDFDFPPALDCELDKGKTPQEITSQIEHLCDYLTDWYGSRNLIYTSQSWWNTHVLRSPRWKLHPLWMAAWSESVFFPWLPEDWKDNPEMVAIWQFIVSDAGREIGADSTRLDLDKAFPLFFQLIGELPPPPEMVTLTVNIVGSGSVLPAGGQYPKGETIQFTATPATGWKFFSWTGDASGTGNIVNVIMDRDKTITATFVEATEKTPYTTYKGRTTVGLNYRTGPGVNYARLGTLPVNTIVDILEERTVSGNIWVRIGYNQWCARIYTGLEYVVYL